MLSVATGYTTSGGEMGALHILARLNSSLCWNYIKKGLLLTIPEHLMK